VEGGERFLPARACPNEKEDTLNADKNAAVNIGLRALAHPDRLDVFPRLRTIKQAGGSVKVRNKRGSFASLPEDDVNRGLRTDWGTRQTEVVSSRGEASAENVEETVAESSEYPDYFVVISGKTDFGLYCTDESRKGSDSIQQMIGDFSAYERPLFLKRVQKVCLDRIKDINLARCSAWKQNSL
jgi:hypothetical protein